MNRSLVGLAELRALTESELERNPEGRVLAVDGRLESGAVHEIATDQGTLPVRRARTLLELREVLAEAEEQEVRIVCLCELPEPPHDADVTSRLVRRRILGVDAWAAVRRRFRAREVDPRLLPHPKVAAALLSFEPPTGYRPVPGGVLSAEHAWESLLEHALGISPELADLQGLLVWSALPERTARAAAAPPELREAAAAWLEDRLGPLARECLLRTDEALPLGLVCGVVFPQPLPPAFLAPPNLDERLREAAIRLEPLLGGRSLPPEVGRRWGRLAAEASDRAAARLDPGQFAAVLARAEAFLAPLRAQDLALLSPVLPSGYEGRLAALGSLLDRCLDGACEPSLLGTAWEWARSHRSAEDHPERLERARMGVRLARWLRADPAPSAPGARPGALAEQYWRELSFVDRARFALAAPDPGKELQAALSRALLLADGRRESSNRDFGEAVAAWMAGGGDAGLPGVEDLLARVAAPLAASQRLLVLVLDGASWPVMHALLEDLGRYGWSPRQSADFRMPCALAVLPSVTEVSRTSLLCGRLARGDADTEKNGFAQHPALSVSGGKPVLFHRASLDGSSAAYKAFTASVESTRQQVVGVVVNAVDDHLARGGQIDYEWRVATIRPLTDLLSAAVRADRAVLVVADHGHVLERETASRADRNGGERWQPADRPPAPGEVEVQGPRLAALGQERLLVPWSERIRYGPKKNGYHGGCSLQELVVPALVLGRLGSALPGWEESPPVRPLWWETSVVPVAPERPPAAAPREQLDLFVDPAPEPEPTPAAPAVLRHPLLAEGLEKLDRPDGVRAMLTHLLQVGGTLSRPALAAALGVPESGLAELLAQADRLLSRDGLRALTGSLDGAEVRLDLELLPRLFPNDSSRRIRVEPVQGRPFDLVLPLPVDAREREALRLVARHGRVTEADLARHLDSRRAGFLMEGLLERLHRVGWRGVTAQDGSDSGRLYVFQRERAAGR